MSISAEQWAALTNVADSLGVTRTELIRHAIADVIDGAVNPAARDPQAELRAELAKARRQLAAVKAALAASEPVAA